MKVLVTGCAGFIGSKVTEFLLNDNISVIGIDNLNDYYDPQLKRFRLKNLEALGGDFTFVKADIEDKVFLKDLFNQCAFDTVYNIAARAGVRASLEVPDIYMGTNVLGLLNLLECMRVHKTQKLVFTSTSSLYAGQAMPFVETLSVNEPISPYAASKKAAEMLCYTYHHLYGIDVSILRCFTVYGPYGRPDMSPDKFMKCIVSGKALPLNGDGTQSRDFTFIDDIARGIILASKPLGYEIINLGNEHPHTIHKMINLLECYLNKKAMIEPHPFNASDMMHTFANTEKARRLLGWCPTVNLEEGLKRMVDKMSFLFDKS
ncbi:MAG: SDR family NAD(P)-dependent oxidoreductase [Puniceicoccales bacterium]|jgi:nucleoside-diphosphate-sugar epimerase|nr:SDR family NAD(P)-dependent oxidoreductase [Puniceicoccales bacterium]